MQLRALIDLKAGETQTVSIYTHSRWIWPLNADLKTVGGSRFDLMIGKQKVSLAINPEWTIFILLINQHRLTVRQVIFISLVNHHGYQA
jgi:hypothetical protein